MATTVCEACAKACDVCGSACAKFHGDKHMAGCAKACRAFSLALDGLK